MPHPLVFQTELLEPRYQMSGIALVHGVLLVQGFVRTGNEIIVGLDTDPQNIVATLRYNNAGGLQTLTRTYPASSLRLVNLLGWAWNDYIQIDQSNGSFTKPVRVNAGYGNDTVIGGDEKDTIFGGSGNDLLQGNAGDDWLIGNIGHDTIFGGDGNDIIRGGFGHSSLVGGEGNDTLVDTVGPDTLLGGNGTDFFIVRYLTDDPVNDFQYGTEHVLRIIPQPEDKNTFLDDLLSNFLGF